MKKVKVISDFLDKFDTNVMYKVGEEREFDDERAADMVDRALAEYIQDVAAPTKEEAEKSVEDEHGAPANEAVVEEEEAKTEAEAADVQEPYNAKAGVKGEAVVAETEAVVEAAAKDEVKTVTKRGRKSTKAEVKE